MFLSLPCCWCMLVTQERSSGAVLVFNRLTVQPTGQLYPAATGAEARIKMTMSKRRWDVDLIEPWPWLCLAYFLCRIGAPLACIRCLQRQELSGKGKISFVSIIAESVSCWLVATVTEFFFFIVGLGFQVESVTHSVSY